MKIVIVMLIVLQLHVNAEMQKNCDEIYKDILDASRKNEHEFVKNKLTGCFFIDKHVVDIINMIKAKYFMYDQEYTKAIFSLELSKNSIEKKYLNRKNELGTKISYDESTGYYFGMLFLYAEVYQQQKQYKKSNKYFIKLDNEQSDINRKLNRGVAKAKIASNYYYLKDYKSSMFYAKEAYRLLNTSENKIEIAYLIAQVYSLEDNLEETIKWLKIPVKTNEKKYLSKIEEDEVFEHFLLNETFRYEIGLKTFIVNQQQVLKMYKGKGDEYTFKFLDQYSIKNKNNIYKVNTLKALIMFKKEEYKQTIALLEKLKKNETNYLKNESDILMIKLYSSSYHKLKQYNKLNKLNDVLLSNIEKMNNEAKGRMYGFLAQNYYYLKKYEEGILYSQKAYSLSKAQKVKVGLSYNIACMYSLKHNLNKTIQWLNEPIRFDKNKYIKKIENDEDFAYFIKNSEFRQRIGLTVIFTKNR